MLDDYIYCSPFLPIASTDAIVADGGGALPDYADPGDSPETALIKKRDSEALDSWAEGLPPRNAEVVQALLRGESQASVARRLRVSEAAISQRLTRLRPRARAQIGHLRRSPLMGWGTATA